MKALICVCIVFLAVLVCAQCFAAAPGMMSYQGKLTDNAGQPLSDGSYSMTFSLFAAETGGTALWTETKSVQVAGGVFSVLLGSVTEMPSSAFQGTTWLQTQVNGSIMSPRTRIVSAGYAMLAKSAESMPNGSILSAMFAPGAVDTSALLDGSVTIQKLADNSVGMTKLANSAVTSSKIMDLTITSNDLATNSITSAKIANGAVTGAKLSPDIQWQINTSVKDHGAVGDGIADDTAAFQAAIDAVSADGGGIAWAPTGTYKIATHLTLKTNVTLQGVFHIQQGKNYAGNYGTTLLAIEGQGNENGTPFIFMQSDSCLEGINIYYPNQSTSSPVAYPWTVRGSGDNCAIKYVLMYNPWNAVDFGTNACGRHNITGLYGQPLHTGIYVDQCYDVGRIQDVHFWPFWADQPGLISYTQANATALKFGRTDGEYVTKCFVLGYSIGFHFVRTPAGNCGGSFSTISADVSGIAVRVDSANQLLITNGLLVANYSSSSVGIYIGSDVDAIVLNSCMFFGASNRIATIDGGKITFSACVFKDWDRNGTSEYAITANSGRLIVNGCDFVDNKNRVRVNSGVSAAIVTSNLGMSNSEISNNIGTKCTSANNQH